MTRAEVLVFLNSLTRLILSGDLNEAARRFNTPLAIYFPQQLVVAKTHAEMVRRLFNYRAQCLSIEVTRIDIRNLAIKDCTGNRALISADLAHLDHSGNMRRFSSVSYVVRRADTAGDLRIELVDYSIPGFPEIAQTNFQPA